MSLRRAFTLLELLVVAVAILGLLAALLTPALSRARQQALCVSAPPTCARWASVDALHHAVQLLPRRGVGTARWPLVAAMWNNDNKP